MKHLNFCIERFFLRGVLILCALLIGCDGDGGEVVAPRGIEVRGMTIKVEPDSPMAERLRVQEVQRALRSPSVVSFPLRIELDPTKVARIHLPFSGKVLGVNVRVGDTVTEGQILLELAGIEIEEFVSEYHQAAAELERAKADLQRAKELYGYSATPKRELLSSETEFKQASAAFSQMEATVALYGIDVEDPRKSLRLIAPIEGEIVSISVAKGDFLAEQEEAIVTIAQLDTVMAVAAVPEHRVGLLGEIYKVNLRVNAFPGRVFQGTWRRLASQADPESKVFALYIGLENGDGLVKPGMLGRAEVLSNPVEMVAVPHGSVVHRGSDSFVLVGTADSTYEFRRVEIGMAREGMVPILEGLDGGKRVVVDGAVLLLEMGGSL